MDMVEIEAQIIEVLGRVDEWLPQNQLTDLRELTRSGEARTALEILCIELFAFNIPVPTDLWERLRYLNRELGIDDDYGDVQATPRMYAQSLKTA